MVFPLEYGNWCHKRKHVEECSGPPCLPVGREFLSVAAIELHLPQLVDGQPLRRETRVSGAVGEALLTTPESLPIQPLRALNKTTIVRTSLFQTLSIKSLQLMYCARDHPHAHVR